MKKLSYTQRLAIAEGIRQNKSNAQIAREIGVHRSTVGREIERNASTREAYAALDANDKSWRRQQAAVPQRMMLFGGVDFFTKLQQHDTIYIYYSRTHRNRLSRFQRYESFFRGTRFSISELPVSESTCFSQNQEVVFANDNFSTIDRLTFLLNAHQSELQLYDWNAAESNKQLYFA